jgi:FtsZ-binding cell division protein ZapB
MTFSNRTYLAQEIRARMSLHQMQKASVHQRKQLPEPRESLQNERKSWQSLGQRTNIQNV